jgi:hypothetical protein
MWTPRTYEERKPGDRRPWSQKRLSSRGPFSDVEYRGPEPEAMSIPGAVAA